MSFETPVLEWQDANVLANAHLLSLPLRPANKLQETSKPTNFKRAGNFFFNVRGH